MTILQDTTTMTHDEMLAMCLALAAENDKLKNKAQGGLKVSAKGAVSVYGLGRFPVTLYQGQWEKLFAMKAEIEGFIVANKGKLSVKE